MDAARHSLNMRRFPLKMITTTDCGRCDERWINDDKSQRGDGSDKVSIDECVYMSVWAWELMCVRARARACSRLSSWREEEMHASM